MTRRQDFPTDRPDVATLPIQGFEGLYSVSNDGRVWSESRYVSHGHSGKLLVNGRWLKAMVGRHGYEMVMLYQEGRFKTLLVHRLVANAWLPCGAPCQTWVNHKNGVKTDNRVTNLEWCTASENLRHSYLHGMHHTGYRKLTSIQVDEIVHRMSAGEKQCSIARLYGVSEALISRMKSQTVISRSSTQGI